MILQFEDDVSYNDLPVPATKLGLGRELCFIKKRHGRWCRQQSQSAK